MRTEMFATAAMLNQWNTKLADPPVTCPRHPAVVMEARGNQITCWVCPRCGWQLTVTEDQERDALGAAELDSLETVGLEPWNSDTVRGSVGGGAVRINSVILDPGSRSGELVFDIRAAGFAVSTCLAAVIVVTSLCAATGFAVPGFFFALIIALISAVVVYRRTERPAGNVAGVELLQPRELRVGHWVVRGRHPGHFESIRSRYLVRVDAVHHNPHQPRVTVSYSDGTVAGFLPTTPLLIAYVLHDDPAAHHLL